MADFYDVFVDWEGRLSREMPGLLVALEGCRRVLDVGCGTGRHVEALCKAGFDAYGADASPAMLEQAIEHTQTPDRFFEWRVGTPPPERERFDAVIAMGNVWPQILEEDEIDAALAGLRDVLRPGGKVVMGMKALEAHRETNNPYLPLLRREHEGEPIWFIRYIDFTPKPPLAEMHMVIAKGENQCVLHKSGRVRSWSASELKKRFEKGGFEHVQVSAKLIDPTAPPVGADVFLRAAMLG